MQQQDLVYKTSDWQRFLYEEERDSNEVIYKQERKGQAKHDNYNAYQRELFARLYNPSTPKLEEPVQGAQWASTLHALCDEVAEFQTLQEHTKGDEQLAGLATATVSKSVLAHMQKQEGNTDIDGMQKRLEALQGMQEQGVNVQDRIDDMLRKLANAKERAEKLAQGLDPAQIRQAVRQACDAAGTQIQEHRDLMAAFQFGDGEGTPQTRQDIAQKKQIADHLKSSSKLKEIAKIAGRLRRVAANKQRTKCDDARNEVADVEQGANIDRLLPSEMLAMCGEDETQELMFFSRFTERQTLQYALRGKEKKGKGPIIICCDESGSMQGDPEIWSKAVSMALLDIAQKQKRDWVFIHFASRVTAVDRVKAGQADPMQIIECMEHFSGGGTSFEAPLEQAMEEIAASPSFKDSDILFITDGCANLSKACQDDLLSLTDRHGTAIYSVLVGGLQPTQQMQEWSTAIYQLEDLLQETSSRTNFENFVFSM